MAKPKSKKMKRRLKVVREIRTKTGEPAKPYTHRKHRKNKVKNRKRDKVVNEAHNQWEGKNKRGFKQWANKMIK